MGNFNKKTKTSQEIPTSALPDIIFILLFFFMVTTKMKPAELKVKNSSAKVTELESLEDMSLVSHLYIGAPNDKTLGTAPRIQANNKFIELSDIPQFIAEQREKLGRKSAQLVVVLKVDVDVDYGLISDVQEALRDLDQRVINYNAIKTSAVKE